MTCITLTESKGSVSESVPRLILIPHQISSSFQMNNLLSSNLLQPFRFPFNFSLCGSMLQYRVGNNGLQQHRKRATNVHL